MSFFSAIFSKRLLMPLSLLALVAAAGASTWSSNGQWASEPLGKYTIYQDGWGSGYQTETLFVNTSSGSAPNFWVTGTQTGGGIKSYPHAQYNRGGATSGQSWTGSWNNSGAPSGSAYDWAFDLWVPSEVMIWTNWSSSVGPYGSLYQSNVSIGGTTYNVYQPGGPWSFLRTSQTKNSSCNVGAVLTWLVSNKHLSNGTVGQSDYGVEITSGSGTWTCNSTSF